jgi:hypothetical protein
LGAKLASFDALNLYVLAGPWFNLSISYLFGSGTFTCTDSEVGDTFEYPDMVRVIGPSFASDVVYYGYYENGWIGETGGFWLLMTNDSYAAGDPVYISTSPFTTCFLAGTRIATPGGETPVESLSIGDLVLGADGRARTVRWIGRQTVVSVFANPQRNFPIRIGAGALGDNTPARDLLVSPDHALLVDGLLVQAAALVDGLAVRHDPAPAPRFTWYHIELEDHALVLAEGAPAETYVDHVTRRRFDNYAEYAALYGADAPSIPELELPRVKSARQLPAAVRARLAARAAAIAGVARVA